MMTLTLDRFPRRVLAALDIETVFKASRCVIAAERLQIFRKLDGKSLTAAEIGRRIGMRGGQREDFLNIIAALGLLTRKGNRYSVAPMARKYFIKERGPHWNRLWTRYCVDDYTALSVLERSLSTGQDYRKILKMKRERDYELIQHDPSSAEDFTRMMHDTKRRESWRLARNLDLSGYSALLDVGGGSGIMAMALVRAHPGLRACVQDFGPVCRAARKIIRAEGLASRVKTYAADMTKEVARGYDVIMFWDIESIPRPSFELAYRALPQHGMLLIGGCFGDRVDRSVNLLTRRLTMVYPDHDTIRETVEKARAAGFSRVKRVRIKDSARAVIGYK
jgi:O-methyltransferase domain/Dimerisation domain